MPDLCSARSLSLVRSFEQTLSAHAACFWGKVHGVFYEGAFCGVIACAAFFAYGAAGRWYSCARGGKGCVCPGFVRDWKLTERRGCPMVGWRHAISRMRWCCAVVVSTIILVGRRSMRGRGIGMTRVLFWLSCRVAGRRGSLLIFLKEA